MAKKNEIQIIIQAVDKASKEISGISGALGKLGKVAALGGAAVAAAGAAIGVAAFNLAKDAAPIEGIKNAFDGLTESMEGGSKKMLEALKESSYGMVKNSDLMMSFNQAAQLVSKDFAEQLPDAMKYLSKVSAATGQDMSFMMDSLVKGVGRMSPMILDNLGIQVDLSMATERAAEMFGKQADELSKAELQAGMMNVVMEKLQQNTADMPEVAGSAAQAMATFQTTIGNLKEEIGLRLLPLFSSVLAGLNNWISSPEGQASVDKFMGWLELVIGTADPPSGLTGIVTYLLAGNIKDAVDLAFGPDSYASITSFVDNVTNAVNDVKKAIDDLKWALQALSDMYNVLSGVSLGNIVSGAILNATGGSSGGFADGGSFIVPGSGSGDRPYTLGLEPGERVTVTPRNRAGGALNLTVNINTPVNLADRSYAERELMPYIEAGVRQILARAT